MGPIPLTNDLKSASELVEALSSLQARLAKSTTSVNTTAVVAELWTIFVQNTPFRESRVLWGSFQRNNQHELQTLQTVYHNDVTAARRAESQRPLSWLRQYGTCGDHLTARPSTLRQAGIGAFATRTLPASTVVAALPMIHIPDRNLLEMFLLLPNDKDEWAIGDDKSVKGHQLLLNYCYGHAESTMLLCPYGPIVSYVNHNQSLANVRLQWASPYKGNVQALFHETVAHIKSSYSSARLAMELVATREIRAGEEIFMDYGDEWEAAWQSHVTSWKPVPGAAVYTSAVQLNSFYRRQSLPLRTAFQEEERQLYPANVQLMCDIACHFEPELVQEHLAAGTLEDYLWNRNLAWWPCVVLESRLDNNSNRYLYKSVLKDIDEPFDAFEVQDAPLEIFHFVDIPYTSDAYLPNAFRHDIRIPDRLFPEAWRNAQKR
jgi:SET domain